LYDAEELNERVTKSENGFESYLQYHLHRLCAGS
jgi:hypothetical protein